MGDVWGPVIGCLGFTALIVLPILANKIIKYKLEIAKINADTTIRTEEIRAKNQLEIEKLMKQEKSRPDVADSYNEALLEKRNAFKERV